jgi:hypothetical protein
LVKGSTPGYSDHRYIISGMENQDKGAGGPSISVEEEREEGMVGEKKGSEGSGGAARNLQMEMDHILEETARKKNLSVMNVKSILRVCACCKNIAQCY